MQDHKYIRVGTHGLMGTLTWTGGTIEGKHNRSCIAIKLWELLGFVWYSYDAVQTLITENNFCLLHNNDGGN